jgi:hypothetical protein
VYELFGRQLRVLTAQNAEKQTSAVKYNSKEEERTIKRIMGLFHDVPLNKGNVQLGLQTFGNTSFEDKRQRQARQRKKKKEEKKEIKLTSLQFLGEHVLTTFQTWPVHWSYERNKRKKRNG